MSEKLLNDSYIFRNGNSNCNAADFQNAKKNKKKRSMNADHIRHRRTHSNQPIDFNHLIAFQYKKKTGQTG
jgi:hypothetical protein